MTASDSNDSDKLFPPGDTLEDLLAAPVPLRESRSATARYYRGRSLDIFVRWELDANNSDANKADEQLDQRCGSDDELRRLLLDTGDQVAHTEQIKVAWTQDHDTSKRYIDLARLGVRAAKLARDISMMLNGGEGLAITYRAWSDSRDEPELRKLVIRLVDFVNCCVDESSLGDYTVANQVAESMMLDLDNKLGKRPADLIARLVCLANGTPVGTALDESTIRRYASKQVKGRWVPKTPTMTSAGRRVWKNDWSLVVEVSKLVPPEARPGAFTKDIRLFLQKPGASPPGPFRSPV